MHEHLRNECQVPNRHRPVQDHLHASLERTMKQLPTAVGVQLGRSTVATINTNLVLGNSFTLNVGGSLTGVAAFTIVPRLLERRVARLAAKYVPGLGSIASVVSACLALITPMFHIVSV